MARRPSRTVGADSTGVLPTNGSEGPIQIANSLPRGFSDGTVVYAQAKQVERYLAQPAGTSSRRVQAQNGRPNG